MTGYGPQETWEEGKKIPFFVALDQEIVYISMDANCKLGEKMCLQQLQKINMV